MSPFPARENQNMHIRYRDLVDAPEDQKHIFQMPKGEPLRRSVTGELFKMHKTHDHWDQVRRSKAYIADKFFPHIKLKDGNLREMFYESAGWEAAEDSEEYVNW